MFRIEFTPAALEDLQGLRRFDQGTILAGVEAQLAHQPAQETRNRKRLRPNALAEWELRLGTFRIFYDVDPGAARVKVVAVGLKRGSILYIHGEEFEL